MVQAGDKVVRIKNVGLRGEKKIYKILEITSVTKTGRMNLADGTILNNDFTERGKTYGAYSTKPYYQLLTDKLNLEIQIDEKRKKLIKVLDNISVSDMPTEDVDKLLTVLEEMQLDS